MAAPRWGAWTTPDGQTEFRLWAPAANEAQLLIDQQSLAMRRSAHGSFACRCEVPADSSYRFRIDGREVADPASRRQAGDVESASMLDDPQGYHWHHPDWRGRPWHEAVICEIHVGSLGGFDGVRERLAELCDAGYTALELMPIGEFPGQRNWGYDGILPFAPESSYGTPDQLRALIDAAHGHGMMVLLDVVYNHLGPSGNMLPQYAPTFFRGDLRTPWGEAIDFRKSAVQAFFIENALMWLNHYRFDGLRLDAVHAIHPPSFLDKFAREIRQGVSPERQVHLLVENEHNDSRLLQSAYTAQWNDDGHNALHVLLTGENEGYYADFRTRPIEHVARVLAEGFVFQGQRDRRGKRRGRPSGELSPLSFVLFLQNHDQIGNRPMGDRLIELIDMPSWRAAMALVALCPMIPLFFMGDEWACRTPFFYFTDYQGELATAVREGRRNEFADFAGFNDPERRERIPDPNALATFDASRPQHGDSAEAQKYRRWFRHLIDLRMQHLVPELQGARALGCTLLSDKALAARWRLGNGALWTLAFNAGEQTLHYRPDGFPVRLHLESEQPAALDDELPPASLAAWCEAAP